MPDVGPERVFGPCRKRRRGAIALERRLRAVELGLAAQHALHRAVAPVAQPGAIGADRTRIHDGRLHHEQARKALGQKLRREQQIGGAGAVADAEYIRQVERLDHPTHILGEILEVIAVGGWLVAVAMAAAVERIDGVIATPVRGRPRPRPRRRSRCRATAARAVCPSRPRPIGQAQCVRRQVRPKCVWGSSWEGLPRILQDHRRSLSPRSSPSACWCCPT